MNIGRNELWMLLAKAAAVAVLILATGFGLWGRIELLAVSGRWTTLFFYIGVWGLSFLAMFIASLQPATWVRLGWAAVIAVTTAAGWTYQAIAGSSLNVFDVLSLWAARHEAGRAMDVYGHVWPWTLGILVITFLVVAIPVDFRQPRLRRALAALSWVPLMPLAVIAAIIFLRHGGGSQALPTQFQPLAVAMVAMERQITHTMPPRMAVPFVPKKRPAARHIVMLVDESVRGDYLDFRPGNRITPALPDLLRVAADFGNAVSGGNCSSYSNAILRFTAQPRDLITSARTYPTIWQWAKKAGFHTVYIDAQSGFVKDPGKLQNFMTVRETRFIDEIIRIEGVPLDQLDFVLLGHVVDRLKSDRPVFIYANKNGAHFPYDADYPADHRHFTPTITDTGRQTLKSKINSYRNTISWNVDRFFARLRERAAGALKDTVIIYTSDHGQNLDPSRLPHCSTDAPPPREGLVPMLAITAGKDL
ncbi:MAG TPA: hypothetical protein ENK13_00230, partial [Thermopetrobacter sp.]|nr:hypothetical protein [Thermopetrobacter sp.]